ncbi:OLC1v1027921C1 [Oldenlandia corymbosa var. corymbosa]|uniref:OLC1v1027921C1 n=1 Tax=Oldenlandia corymbosa var. corymbosa TaxID=529605 RepID=A0AAV1CAT0_OLDCO|nr:OLC1v1027921C1 [Oldenlandia corymbosa var. corymbosa]
MGKFHLQKGSVGSVVLDQPLTGVGQHFNKKTSSWSASSFRRIILDTVRCGVRHHRHHKHHTPTPHSPPLLLDSDLPSNSQFTPPNHLPTTLRSELKKSTSISNGGCLRSDNNKLCDLLRVASELSSSQDEMIDLQKKRKMEALEELKRVVLQLQDEENQSGVLDGAREIRRLTKDDAEARANLGLLGAIPPLVALLDAPPPYRDLPFQVAALYALLNLGIGNDANKSAIVKAGAVHKMLKLISSADGHPDTDPDVAEAIVANLLALTALDENKPVVGSSGAIPFLISTLKDPHHRYSYQAKHDALRALYNLSISPLNLSPLLEAGLVPFLFCKLGDMNVSERVLSILGNIVSMPEGRRAISYTVDAFPALVDVLNWTDSPGCQEKGSYILMVMAHKAYGDRQAMVEAGITSSLLELTLLGTTLAQKRASRILECLTLDKGKQVSGNSYGGGGLSPTLSAPLCDQSLQLDNEELEDGDDMVSEERKAVKLLVQQSLQNNMNRIVRRANLPHDFVPSDNLKSSMALGSTSKSLPF